MARLPPPSAPLRLWHETPCARISPFCFRLRQHVHHALVARRPVRLGRAMDQHDIDVVHSQLPLEPVKVPSHSLPDSRVSVFVSTVTRSRGNRASAPPSRKDGSHTSPRRIEKSQPVLVVTIGQQLHKRVRPQPRLVRSCLPPPIVPVPIASRLVRIPVLPQYHLIVSPKLRWQRFKRQPRSVPSSRPPGHTRPLRYPCRPKRTRRPSKKLSPLHLRNSLVWIAPEDHYDTPLPASFEQPSYCSIRNIPSRRDANLASHSPPLLPASRSNRRWLRIDTATSPDFLPIPKTNQSTSETSWIVASSSKPPQPSAPSPGSPPGTSLPSPAPLPSATATLVPCPFLLDPALTGLSDAERATSLFAVSSNRQRPPSSGRNLFPQSVASGDPRPDGIVLWTRVEPSLQQAPSGDRLAWQIGTDPAFPSASILIEGIALISPDHDSTVKFSVAHPVLEPFTNYFFRFLYNTVPQPPWPLQNPPPRHRLAPGAQARLRRLPGLR